MANLKSNIFHINMVGNYTVRDYELNVSNNIINSYYGDNHNLLILE